MCTTTQISACINLLPTRPTLLGAPTQVVHRPPLFNTVPIVNTNSKSTRELNSRNNYITTPPSDPPLSKELTGPEDAPYCSDHTRQNTLPLHIDIPLMTKPFRPTPLWAPTRGPECARCAHPGQADPPIQPTKPHTHGPHLHGYRTRGPPASQPGPPQLGPKPKPVLR